MCEVIDIRENIRYYCLGCNSRLKQYYRNLSSHSYACDNEKCSRFGLETLLAKVKISKVIKRRYKDHPEKLKWVWDGLRNVR